MVKHRAIYQWDRWLTEFSGHYLLDSEQQFLSPILQDCYGNHALLIGSPRQYGLMKSSVIPHHVLLSPLIDKSKTIQYVESGFYELPFATASIDLVVVPHVIEYIDNPQQLLAESCRVVKPEGYIIILGFNPNSIWGLKKKITSERHVPWSGHFISVAMVKKWLKLADFELVMQETFLFCPPLLHHAKLFQKLKGMEWIGRGLKLPWGGVYFLMAKAKVVPMTPIKLHWKQKFSGAHVSFPITTVRNLRKI